ncbi:hypothetical protein [Prochlorococcus marinus]|uniref:hypothetical protein n=1 Tax=Prochlorococcus marinus TaxID=1219 RepID=UPI0012DA1606|nr:hypothetical protein [Prochlorococcus marinus]
MTNELLEQELALDELKEMNGGFGLGLLLLLVGCGGKKKEEDPATWIDGLSTEAIRQSGSTHEHPIYGNPNNSSSTQVKDGGCTDSCLPF